MKSVFIADAVDFIAKKEGFRPTPYKNFEKEPLTVGYGTLVDDLSVCEKFPMTESRARSLLEQRITSDWEFVDKLVTVKLTENQAIALISLCYNIGRDAFSHSTLLKKLNESDYDTASSQFLVWKKVNGKTSNGLLKRREEEKSIFDNRNCATIGGAIYAKSSTRKAAAATIASSGSLGVDAISKHWDASIPLMQALLNTAPYAAITCIALLACWWILKERKAKAMEYRI